MTLDFEGQNKVKGHFFFLWYAMVGQAALPEKIT